MAGKRLQSFPSLCSGKTHQLGEAIAKSFVSQRGGGILPVIHGWDAHATGGRQVALGSFHCHFEGPDRRSADWLVGKNLNYATCCHVERSATKSRHLDLASQRWFFRSDT